MALTQEQLRNFKITYKTPGGLNIPSREEMHKEYGGRVYLSDYNSYVSPVDMVRRIFSDQRFDHMCCMNDGQRKFERGFNNGFSIGRY